MNRNKGFTLIELLIVVAIIAIIVIAIAGAFGPRKAGAHEVTPDALRAAMAEVGADYVWHPGSHRLIVINKGTAEWTTALDVCAAIKGSVDHAHVTLRSNTGAGELEWVEPGRAGETRKLTNLPTSSTAEC